MHWLIIALLGGTAGAAFGASTMYGTMIIRERIVVSGAVSTERNAGIVVCNARVGEIEAAHNGAIAKAVEDATTAAAAVSVTPDAPAELAALCKADDACRKDTP